MSATTHETAAATAPKAKAKAPARKGKALAGTLDDAHVPLLIAAVERSLAGGGAAAPSASDPFRNEVLPKFNKTRQEWLGLARRIALELHKRLQRPITVDDVRAVCPPPKEFDGRVMGAIFRTGEWEWHGYVRSTRTTCHKRGISAFTPA